MSGKKQPHLNALINGIFALGLLFIMASVAGLFATWLLVDRVSGSSSFSHPESESTLSAQK